MARGYPSAAVGDIAALAGVSVDTVHSSVGRKPVLPRELVETSLSGRDHAVPAGQRDHVLLVHERGWTPEQFREWITDSWTRALPA